MVKFKQKSISSVFPLMASATHLYCPLENRIPLKEKCTVVFTVSPFRALQKEYMSSDPRQITSLRSGKFMEFTDNLRLKYNFLISLLGMKEKCKYPWLPFIVIQGLTSIERGTLLLPQWEYQTLESEELQIHCSSPGSVNMEENRVEKSINGNMIQYL